MEGTPTHILENAIIFNLYHKVTFTQLVTGPQWKGWHYYRYEHGIRKYGLDISKMFLS